MTETSQAPQDGSAPSAPADPSQPPQVGTAPSAPAANAPQPNPAIPLAVDIGWTMAVLSGALRAIASNEQSTVSDGLPTAHELSPTDRKDLEEGRVNVLLARLGGLLPANPAAESGVPQVQLNSGDAGDGATPAQAPDPAAAQAPDPAAAKSDQDLLTEANLGILEWLACAGREFGLAYQLGLALRDTANPPLPAGADPTVTRDTLVKQLSRSRVATIQDWLTTLDPDLPDSSARIVSVSLGRWADLISTIFDKRTPGGLRASQSEADVTVELTRALLPQGDAWIDLLTGAESSDRLLTPEGYVAAGEAALGRSARIVKRVAAHYSLVLVIILAALGGVLYFAASGISGAGRAWTQIAAVATSLGVTYKGIITLVARLSAEAERPIYNVEKIDAMAWAVTIVPAQLKFTLRGKRALRRSGILPPGPMGGT